MEFVKYDIITRDLKLAFAIRCDIGNVQDIYVQHVLVEENRKESCHVNIQHQYLVRVFHKYERGISIL